MSEIPVLTPVSPALRWYRVDEALPEPLHDVLIEVVLVPDDDPAVQLGYRRADGRWFLVAVEDIEIQPTRWTALPVPDGSLFEREAVQAQFSWSCGLNPNTQEPFTLGNFVSLLAREEIYRARVYPRLVAEGRMNKREAEYQLAAISALRGLLQRQLDAVS